MRSKLILLLLFVASYEAVAQTTEMISEIPATSLSRWRVSTDAGVAYFMNPIDITCGEGQTDSSHSSRLGYTYGAEACYYFTNDDDISYDFGVGVRIKNTHFSQTSNVTSIDVDGTELSCGLTDNIDLLSIAPFATARLFLFGNRNIIFFNVAPFCYASYTNNAVFLDYYRIKRSTNGLYLELIYDRAITNRFCIGTSFTFNACSFPDYTKFYFDGSKEIVPLQQGERAGMANFALTAGLSYCF